MTILWEDCAAEWRATPATLPPFGRPVSPYRQWQNGRAAAATIDEIGARLADYPLEPERQGVWRDAVRRRLTDCGERHLAWSPAYVRMLAADDFYGTAAAFGRMARGFDPALSIADLGQALRNVWVANTLQILVGAPVRLPAGLFAYSMLYPATDNVLDAADISGLDKRGFNQRLGRWLTGDAARPATVAERKVRALVDILERDYPRAEYPGVWISVLDIYRAQTASLTQQRDGLLSEADLLDLTLTKGGTSVRADLFLVAGTPDPRAERLSFLYGAFLQMLDDLQDVEADLGAGHQTLFTRAVRAGTLDTLTRQLAHFIDRVLARHAGSGSEAWTACTELVRQNCLTLVVGVIARQPHLFDRTLRAEVERQWPLRLATIRRLLDRGRRRFQQAKPHLAARHGTHSVLELLLGSRGSASDVGTTAV